MKHFYRTAAQILRANGYAPAAIPDGHQLPPGPWGLGAMDYSEYERPDSTASAAVFTTLHLRPGVFAGAIADPASTWLATITATPDADIETVIARHIGAKSPHRVADDGSITWPVKTNGRNFNPFELVSRNGNVRVVAGAPSFMVLAGDWCNGDPISVPRDELPEIDRTRAEALMSEIDAQLLARTPVPSFEFAAPKLAPAVTSLPRDGDLRYGNQPALDRLRENGYEVCAVPWGAQLPDSDDWKRGLTGAQFDRPAPEHGVGIVTAAPPMKWSQHSHETWIATLTLRTGLRELKDLVASQLGKCPVRESSDGTLIFMLRQDGRYTWPPVEFTGSLKDGYIDITGTRSTLRVESRNSVLVVTGLDAAKKPYRWRNGDPLSVPRAELPVMNDNRARNLVRDVQRLMERLSLERAG